ncbi:MAG TPA: MFS transporter [Porticoccaceae bacterium]|jgi:MFS family permease|nr:MFS transporter [Porticoccaceae bacterium]
MAIHKIFYGWKIVGTSIVCYSAAPGQFAVGILGLFVIPLQLEFGWSRADIFLSTTFITLTQAIFTPLLGSLIDKYGSKKVMMPSIFLFGLLLGGIPLFVGDLADLYLFYGIIGVLSGGAAAVPYLRLAGAWFVKRRGLAFGLIMSGGGLGYAYSPPLVQYMIDNYGWRSGYYALAAIVIFLVLPLIQLFIHDHPRDLKLLADGDTVDADESVVAADEEEKTKLGELLRMPLFYQLFATFMLLTFCLYGLMSNLVPMLLDRGMDTTGAALAASTVGITIIVSRIVIGFLLDKFFAPRVGMVCFLLSAMGTAFLAFGAVGPTAFIAAIFFGFSVGAELDLLAYLITRYFGISAFGMVYGILFAAFLGGVSIGPVVFGRLFDFYGSYVNILSICSCILVITSISMLFLPKYKTR